MIKGITPQKIIQGQTYSLTLKPKNEADIEKINKLWFSCSSLNLLEAFEYNSETKKYSIELSWEQTQLLKPINTTFNITIQFIGEAKKRMLANNVPLLVVKNDNPVGEESDE